MKKIICILPVAIFTCLLLFFSSSALNVAADSMKLCAESIVPSLFPFFVCSNLLVNLGTANILSKLFSPFMRPLFGLNGSCSLALIMGYISGYPVGAKTVADLYSNGSCLKHEAEKMLAYCNNCGPMFIIGALGSGMLGDANAGAMLYLSHILSSLVVAFILRTSSPCRYKVISTPLENSGIGFGELFTSAVSSSISLTLTVCGYVILFGLSVSFIESLGVINALSSLGIDYSVCKSLVYGLIECSGGCKEVISAIKTPLVRYMLLSSVIAWSGISVHMQVLGIIKKAKLSPKLYFKGKALMAIISPVITMFIYLIKNGRISVFLLIQLVVIISAAVFTMVKIVFLLRKFYFKYSAEPPR